MSVRVISDRCQEFAGTYYYRNKQGYYVDYNDDEYPRLHRVVYELYHGYIPCDCDIHHIDCNRANNNIENLICLTKEEHRAVHAEIRRQRKDIIDLAAKFRSWAKMDSAFQGTF